MAHISKIYRTLLSALLALLGFSCGSCGGIFSAPVEYGSPPNPEYGTPRATYKAKGVVVSEANDSPIKGIRAVLKRDNKDWPMDTDIKDTYPWAVYTNSDGSFFLELQEFPRQKLYVELIDVDGEENGSFAGKKIEADYTNSTFTGGSGTWYSGEAEIDLGKIKMKLE